MTLNVSHTCERMCIDLSSVTRAIQSVREIVGEVDAAAAAAKLIKSILSLDVKFDDGDKARVTALAVAEALARCKGEVGDEAELYAAAVKRAQEHMDAPRNRWMYTKAEDVDKPVETKAIEGTDLNVVIRADGKIKRGGKADVAAALFKKHVLESATPCDNACFVKILMVHGEMSQAGARTYAHNLRKQHGMVAK